AIASSLEIRGLDSTSHTPRVTAYAMRLTVEVSPSLTDDPGLEWGYMFHDIGNIGIPDEILRKRGSLRNDEWLLMHQHTTIGEQLLAGVPLRRGGGIRVLRPPPERWDGSGYPDRLSGRDIPLAARIFAVADALDAMTDRRPYRRPLRWEAAIARIRKSAGSQFDPDVVDGLIACEPDLVEIRNRFAGGTDGPRSEVTTPLSAPADWTTAGSPSAVALRVALGVCAILVALLLGSGAAPARRPLPAYKVALAAIDRQASRGHLTSGDAARYRAVVQRTARLA